MVRRLLDAATVVLRDEGYADATVQRICAHAGVSQGALFRHFATKEAFMAAVGVDVSEQTLSVYRQRFRPLPDDSDTVRSALGLLREICRSDLSIVWAELSMAARTRPHLRAAIEPVRLEHHRASVELARSLVPQVAQALGDRFEPVMQMIITIFDGECVESFVTPRPQVDAARLALLLDWIETLMSAENR